MITKYSCTVCTYKFTIGFVFSRGLPLEYRASTFGCCYSCGELYHIKHGVKNTGSEYLMDYQIVAVSVPIGKLKDLSEWYKKYNKVRYSVEKEWQTMPFILETKESRSDIMLARKKYEIRGIQIEVVEKPRCKNPRYGMWVNDALFQMGNIALNQEEKFIQYAEDIKNEPIQCVTEGCNDFVSFGSPDNGTECPKCGRGILYISSCPKT